MLAIVFPNFSTWTREPQVCVEAGRGSFVFFKVALGMKHRLILEVCRLQLRIQEVRATQTLFSRRSLNPESTQRIRLPQLRTPCNRRRSQRPVRNPITKLRRPGWSTVEQAGSRWAVVCRPHGVQDVCHGNLMHRIFPRYDADRNHSRSL